MRDLPATNLKICGITDRATAQFCTTAGVGALGVVFYTPSPRAVTAAQAQTIFSGLPRHVARVGVFVDQPPITVIAIAQQAGLDTAQLHGSESVNDIQRIMHAGIHVVKVLKTGGIQLEQVAGTIPQSAGILVECSLGLLPGGNGMAWDWSGAAVLAGKRPFAVAGGLTAANLRQAALTSGAIAWDLSSGVEHAPGIKNHTAISATLAVARTLVCSTDTFWKSAQI